MWPTLYEVQTGAGPVGLHTYGLMILLAFCAAFLLTHLRAQQVGLHPDRLLLVYVAAAVGGLTGGRLLYALAVDPAGLLRNPMSLFSFSGFAVYGGLVGGALAVGALALAQKIPIWKLADIAGPAVLIGMGVGRLGCFFAGCCHGAEAPVAEVARPLLPEGLLQGQLWLSEVFPFLSLEFHGGVGSLKRIPLYPTQLWAVVYLLGLSALLSAVWRHRRFDGQIAALTLILEPPFRVLVETFRADTRGYVVTWEASDRMIAMFPGMARAGGDIAANVMGLTTSQALGLLAIPVGVALYAARRNAGVAPERSVEEQELDEMSS